MIFQLCAFECTDHYLRSFPQKVWKTLFYFASGGSSCPIIFLRMGISARSILQMVSMVLIMSLSCSPDRRAAVEVVRVIEPAAPASAPRLPHLA